MDKPNKQLKQGLSLREVCAMVYNHYDYYEIFIFNPNIKEDVEKKFEESKNSVFEFWFCNEDGDEEVDFVAIGFRGEKGNKPLPLWLIENKEWIVRVEKTKGE